MPERQTIAVDAPVVEVLLLEDRARVTRRGTAQLPAGTVRVEVREVSPVLSDRTLTARVLSPARVRVCDARVARLQKARREDRPVEVGVLEGALEEARQEQEELADQDLVIEGRLKGLERIEELVLEDLTQDAAWNRHTRVESGNQLDVVQREAAALYSKRAALQVRTEKQREDLRDLEQRLALARSPATTAGANLEADIQADDGGPCELEFTYIVPGACWRPWHTATRVPGDRPQVLIRSDACVWQNTGEDWRGVQLRFSTERALLGVEPPSLESDILEARPKSPVVKVALREQTVETTGMGAGVEATAEVPGVDDGGEVFAVAGSVKADIPSDGRPYRVPYAGFQADAESDLVLMAELAPAVIRKTVQTNTGSLPLLAGPVDLIAEGGFAGRTQVRLVAPHERFALGWGPDSAVRVHRDLEEAEEKSGMMSNMLTTRRVVTVRLSNIGADETEIAATERVPVSEIEQVEIAVDRKETTQGAAPDENGFVTWSVRLRPFSQETLRLVYTMRGRKEIAGV